MSDVEHHTIWGVYSEDGVVYAVKPNDRETAERECLLLRQGDEYGQKEPAAKVSEWRTCTWSQHLLHEPREALTGREWPPSDIETKSVE